MRSLLMPKQLQLLSWECDQQQRKQTGDWYETVAAMRIDPRYPSSQLWATNATDGMDASAVAVHSGPARSPKSAGHLEKNVGDNIQLGTCWALEVGIIGVFVFILFVCLRV